jgi:hypothetical protein
MGWFPSYDFSIYPLQTSRSSTRWNVGRRATPLSIIPAAMSQKPLFGDWYLQAVIRRAEISIAVIRSEKSVLGHGRSFAAESVKHS